MLVFGQALFERRVDVGFERFVERGGGFVEEEPVGLREQRARDRDALLLAAREALSPIAFLIELALELGQLRGVQGRLDLIAWIGAGLAWDR